MLGRHGRIKCVDLTKRPNQIDHDTELARHLLGSAGRFGRNMKSEDKYRIPKLLLLVRAFAYQNR